MGFLKNTAYVAAGYGLSELLHEGKQEQKEEFPQKSLEDIVDEYAHAHDVWGRDERFYQTLLMIAEKYHDPYAK